jgi:hypothetical protein
MEDERETETYKLRPLGSDRFFSDLSLPEQAHFADETSTALGRDHSMCLVLLKRVGIIGAVSIITEAIVRSLGVPHIIAVAGLILEVVIVSLWLAAFFLEQTVVKKKRYWLYDILSEMHRAGRLEIQTQLIEKEERRLRKE